MKMLLFIPLFFLATQTHLKIGTYHALKGKAEGFDEEQEITLYSNGTFRRSLYDIKTGFGKQREKVAGSWFQNTDTLVLSDTFHLQEFSPKVIKHHYGVEDTVVIRTTKFVVQKSDRLHFLSSAAGKLVYKLPDFIFSEKE